MGMYAGKMCKCMCCNRSAEVDYWWRTAASTVQVGGDKAAAAKQIKALYDLFVKADCTMVEVSSAWLIEVKCQPKSVFGAEWSRFCQCPWKMPCHSTRYISSCMYGCL